LLTELGIDLERIDYMAEPLTESQPRALLQKAGLRPRDVVHTKEPGARGLPTEDDEATLQALALHPKRLQRAIVECDTRAVLTRPTEKALELVG
jgi:arsenate reductase-like glutaredoxin family protein